MESRMGDPDCRSALYVQQMGTRSPRHRTSRAAAEVGCSPESRSNQSSCSDKELDCLVRLPQRCMDCA
eukprot:400896-Pyramimonas_sp.AAC.1